MKQDIAVGQIFEPLYVYKMLQVTKFGFKVGFLPHTSF